MDATWPASIEALPGELRARLVLAIEAAIEAGESTLPMFHRRTYTVEAKTDGSAVTQADRGAERLLRRRIAERFPADAVLGEEFGQDRGTGAVAGELGSWRWVIDPIDGTASFVRGVPLFGTLVAVEHEGEVVAGVIRMPALGETVFAARGAGAWHGVDGVSPVEARASRAGTLSEATVAMTSLDYFDKRGVRSAYLAVCDAAGETRGWSDCYGHFLAAVGRVDAVVEPPGLKEWDLAPMRVILPEAGGVFVGWDGGARSSDGSAVVGAADLAEDLLRAVRGPSGGAR